MCDTSIVTRLRDASAGHDVWRVKDKGEDSYCIEFELSEKLEAERWWNDAKDLEWNKNRELALVRVLTTSDTLMREAADMLESLFGQMQSEPNTRLAELTAVMRRMQRECAAAGAAVTQKQLAARQLAEIQVDAELNLVERR